MGPGSPDSAGPCAGCSGGERTPGRGHSRTPAAPEPGPRSPSRSRPPTPPHGGSFGGAGPRFLPRPFTERAVRQLPPRARLVSGSRGPPTLRPGGVRSAWRGKAGRTGARGGPGRGPCGGGLASDFLTRAQSAGRPALGVSTADLGSWSSELGEGRGAGEILPRRKEL